MGRGLYCSWNIAWILFSFIIYFHDKAPICKCFASNSGCTFDNDVSNYAQGKLL